jgi:hypothetical protein
VANWCGITIDEVRLKGKIEKWVELLLTQYMLLLVASIRGAIRLGCESPRKNVALSI